MVAGEVGPVVRFHIAGLPSAGIVATTLRVQPPTGSVVEWDHTRAGLVLSHTLAPGDLVAGEYQFQAIVEYATGITPRRTRIRTVLVDEAL